MKGQEISLSEFKGKVLLIVNTASKCGFTPQFEGLEKLYTTYKDRGFAVLGFPCNQFAEQDPASNGEIQEFCRLNYGVTFPMFQKGDVRGETAQPLFKYLVKEKGFKGLDMDHPNAQNLLNFIKKNWIGIMVCFIIAVPSWLIGKRFPVVGGPIIAILAGMLGQKAANKCRCVCSPGCGRPAMERHQPKQKYNF